MRNGWSVIKILPRFKTGFKVHQMNTNPWENCPFTEHNRYMISDCANCHLSPLCPLVWKFHTPLDYLAMSRIINGL